MNIKNQCQIKPKNDEGKFESVLFLKKNVYTVENVVQFSLFLVMFLVRFSVDVCGYPVDSVDLNAQNQRLDIYKRQNSEFNRLQSNQIDYSRYENINDQVPKHATENDIDTSESRRFGGIRRRPCVPVYGKRAKKQQRRNGNLNGNGNGYGYGNGNDGRTLYDLNFYFLGYQPNQYQVTQGSGALSPIAAVDNNKPVSQYDHYGGYYDCEPNPFYRPPHYVGGNYGSGALSDDPNRPSYLGLLGQGFYDFINGLFGYGNPNAGSGGYDTPVSGSAGSILNEGNDDRPVYEVNVPDTIAALVISNIIITIRIFCFSN